MPVNSRWDLIRGLKGSLNVLTCDTSNKPSYNLAPLRSEERYVKFIVYELVLLHDQADVLSVKALFITDTTNPKPKTVTRKSITTDVTQYLNHRPLTARVVMLPSIHVNDVTDILLHRSHKCMEAMRLHYLKFPFR